MSFASVRSWRSMAGVHTCCTRRATNCSSTIRSDEISSSWRAVSAATRAPRRGSRSTSPSSASRASASRTGMCDTPSSAASGRSGSRVPGG